MGNVHLILFLILMFYLKNIQISMLILCNFSKSLHIKIHGSQNLLREDRVKEFSLLTILTTSILMKTK